MNERREVLHVFGDAARFLKHSVGQMSDDIASMTHGDFRLALVSSLQNVSKKGERVELKGIRYQDKGGGSILNIIAEPINDKYRSTKSTMLLFEERETRTPLEDIHPAANFEASEEARQRIISLEQELLHTREVLQATIEELETSGEELQASNEELLASNEEMQSTNEELHSVNEELYSVNSEHEQKIKELNELTTDWRNLVRSTDIGIVFLRNDYSIRLFSPKATEVFNLLPQDVGRDMRHITSRIVNDDIFVALARVSTTRNPEESRLSFVDGRTFLRRVLPYEGPDKSTSGMVITLVDISDSARAETSLRASESRFRSMINAIGEGILLIRRNGIIISCNNEMEQMFGIPASQILDTAFSDIPQLQLMDEDGQLFASGESPIEMCLASDSSARGIVMGLRCGDEKCLWVIVNAEPIAVPGDAELATMLFSLTDITQRKLIEEELRIAAVAIETLEGVMVVDANVRILRVNNAFVRITGYTQEEVIGRKPSLLKSGRQDAAFYDAMWISLNKEGSWQGEMWNRRKDGSEYPQWLTISSINNAAGKRTHYVATFLDISDRKNSEERILQMAFYDALTNLPNRRLLMDRLERAIVSSARSGQFCALVIMDLDNFKSINDVYGHALGDALLVDVAERLKLTIRDCDTVARLGGDEFVMVLENFGSNELTASAYIQERVNSVIAIVGEPYYLLVNERQDRFDISVSCGICIFQGQKVSTADLLKRADVALYQAKNAGRNTSRFFSDLTQQEINHSAQLEAGLRRAIREEQFQLYLQPLFNSDCKITAAEALIRWQQPDGTVISPADFIPFSEKNGLILQIGNWVLENSCIILKKWAAHHTTASLRLAINISARQFHEPLFCETVAEALKRHNICPDRLELELTESVVIDDLNQAVAKMNSLRELGVHLSLDDFGSGYSSLTYLKRLPFEKIKIDQSFVREIMNDPDDAIIVRTIIAMGRALRLEVTAEGVETEEQLKYLSLQGCLLFQGYLFSPPLPFAAFDLFIENRLTPDFVIKTFDA